MDVCDVKTSSGPSATPTTSAEPSAVVLTDNDRKELHAHLAADGNGQQEIADMAANENKDQNEIKMLHEFLIQRLWSAFMKKKMEKEMNRHMAIEEAF